MSKVYRPLGWSLIKVAPDDEDEYYIVFVSGLKRSLYKWRLSSGFDSLNVPLENDCLVIEQDSGSVYKLPLFGYGMHDSDSAKVLETFVASHVGPDVSVVLVDLSVDDDGCAVYPLKEDDKDQAQLTKSSV
ncbi:hypothetical protein [Photobacterium damselae]|uniref:hypothetical protein n=1 Tax=Photobacterium damselae TaxID=38293 RepID=UPI0040691040